MQLSTSERNILLELLDFCIDRSYRSKDCVSHFKFLHILVFNVCSLCALQMQNSDRTDLFCTFLYTLVHTVNRNVKDFEIMAKAEK